MTLAAVETLAKLELETVAMWEAPMTWAAAETLVTLAQGPLAMLVAPTTLAAQAMLAMWALTLVLVWAGPMT